MEIKLAGVDSFIIYFGNEITKEINDKVKAIFEYLKKLNLDEIIDIVPSYSSIFIRYDLFKCEYKTIKNKVFNIIKEVKEKKNYKSNIIEIDVYYGEEVGFDLQRISKLKNISISEIIKLHTSQIYDVYTIGFLPAFAYLGVVNSKIASPRLETPRKKIPKNSVAIADFQTAIYPLSSPGGWNIIGRTYQNIYDKTYENLSLINFNDKVKFNSISKKEFLSKGGTLES